MTTSLHALGEHYQRFVFESGLDRSEKNVRLYVNELRTGCILCSLQPFSEQASFALAHVETLAAFVTHLNDILQFFRGLSERPSGLSREDAQNITNFVEPTAKDGGAILILNVSGGSTANVQITSDQANSAQNGIRRFLGPPLPQSGWFQKEPLYLRQLRDDVRGQAGDRGVIERFSQRPVKLQFMNEEAKRAILDQSYPFRMIFIIDGEMSTVEGKPALYKVHYVHDFMEKPDPD